MSKTKQIIGIIYKATIVLLLAICLLGIYTEISNGNIVAMVLILFFSAYIVFVCWKPFAYKRILFLLLGTFLFFYFIRSTYFVDSFYDRFAYVDAVMVNDELYFVLEEQYKISMARVIKATAPVDINKRTVWSAGIPPENGNLSYPKMRQIKYGDNERFKEFSEQKIPMQLKKNLLYEANCGIVTNERIRSDVQFTILSGNKVIMHGKREISPELPKNHTVTIERNGNKITVPYTVSFIKNKDGDIVKKIIVSNSVPEK